MPIINVSAIPAYADNYIWLIRTGGTACAIVDPGDAGPVLKELDEAGLDLRYILLTHHHPDHIGGMPELKRQTGATVFGPSDTRIPGIDHIMREGDVARLPGLDLEFDVLEVPGHTATHIVFTGHESLFCGDTLFSVGCGRLFEGTAEQMQASLDKLSELPPETRIYCGHEYTLSNCRFALEVEPDNADLLRKTKLVEAQRAAGQITLPGVMSEELKVNPFLRSRVESVIKAARNRNAGTTAGASTLAVIRQWKDRW